ncbi:hypothetical protein [Acidimangrovimonas sediminis]|uniref:hypothetical protein n=1 Tax=Acidimangrovimonas sediminis TaxID=2056283 RepID=UPI000C80876C|nr:hypothetical protein [Acidimangrovimonas sediminis]
MTPEDIAPLFTRTDGSYLCARWGRPIAPVVFGVQDATLATVKGALEAVSAMVRHPLAETDPELGANLMVFFLRDWAELAEVPGLGHMIPGLDLLVQRLADEGASQYRTFRFDGQGAIRAVFTFVAMKGPMAEIPAEEIALAQAAQAMLSWSEPAFAARSPLARTGVGGAGGGAGGVILHPEIAGILRAAYDPRMPSVGRDPSHALRLAARLAIG